jgi:iron complex transport system substrate-binding protein
MPSRVFTFKLKPVLIALLATILIVACQNNIVRQATNSQQADCRTVQHSLGEVCIPQTPQRLVVLDDVTLADALVLGVPSIGVATPDDMQLDYLMKQMKNREGLELLGQSDRPSLEKILKLKPDLILGIKFFGEPIFPLLSQIAPTAVGKWIGASSWREYFGFVAHVLSKEAEAQQVWDSYNRRIAEIKAALGDELHNIKISTVYANSNGIYINGTKSFAGSILADVGIRRPKIYANLEDGKPLSEEAILDIDADILFVYSYNADSEKTLANWEQKPLWNQLKAVKEERVYIVNASIWKGLNPIAANLVLDDLYKYLVNK